MQENVSKVVVVCVLLSGALSISTPVLADKPTPTPAPSPTPYPTSLSEYAKQIKLRKPGGTKKKDGAIVISDQDIDPERLDPESDKFKDQDAPVEQHQISKKETDHEEDKGDKQKRKEETQQKKELWQQRYRDQQQHIDELQAEIADLNLEIPKLQNQFYSWDDPFYRDGVIKPQLDEAMARRQELQQQLPKAQTELKKILNDARRDGALPGWFREIEKK